MRRLLPMYVQMEYLMPIRVFLLSNNRFLREALCHVLKSHADVLVVGAEESSAGVIAEIMESACDVLLVEPLGLYDFERQVLERLEGALIGLKIVAIDMEAKITDAISAIRMTAQGETGPSLSESRWPVDTKSTRS